MRAKEMKLMITFENTVDAMRMEGVCQKEKMPGRLIPVPREITAGCGLCFMTTPEAEESTDIIMRENNILYQDKVKMLF